jgi:hypothetical protein
LTETRATTGNVPRSSSVFLQGEAVPIDFALPKYSGYVRRIGACSQFAASGE